MSKDLYIVKAIVFGTSILRINEPLKNWFYYGIGLSFNGARNFFR